MNFDELWEELERRLPPGLPGRQQQRIIPDSQADLTLAVVAPGARRSLTLTVPSEAVAELDGPPAARGVEVLVHEGRPDGCTTLELLLVDDALRDVFTPLCTDVARAAASATDDVSAVIAWRGRLARWQRLLQRAARGLSGERQRGLFGELWFLTERLGPVAGADRAIAAWTGPDGSVHDFQSAGGAVEVKTSAANEPQVVRINGERQLDDAAVPALHLVHLSLEVRRDSGRTLPAAVERARSLASVGPALPLLEDRLIAYGYVDAHEPLYRHVGYTLRDTSTFRIAAGFPRIVESDLPGGVGRVHYDLAIAACEPFAAPEREMLANLIEATRA